MAWRDFAQTCKDEGWTLRSDGRCTKKVSFTNRQHTKTERLIQIIPDGKEFVVFEGSPWDSGSDTSFKLPNHPAAFKLAKRIEAAEGKPEAMLKLADSYELWAEGFSDEYEKNEQGRLESSGSDADSFRQWR